MIAVAIVAILAAVAIPAVYNYQLNARASELEVVLYSVLDAQRAYHFTHDAWITALRNPSGVVGKTPRAWESVAEWEELGFAPDGEVRCSYQTSSGFAGGECNLDGDAPNIHFEWHAELIINGGPVNENVQRLDMCEFGFVARTPGLCW